MMVPLTALSSSMPSLTAPLLPDRTLPAPGWPIRLLSLPAPTAMPSPSLPKAALPVTVVPMRLPMMVLASLLSTMTPPPVLPEMRLRAATVVPPMVVGPEPPCRSIP